MSKPKIICCLSYYLVLSFQMSVAGVTTKDEKYKAQIVVKSTYGPYVWCNNSSIETKAGCYLSNKDSKTASVPMIWIDIEMNDALFKQTDFIEMVQNNGFRAQYSTEKLKKKHTFLFQNSDNVKEINVCFRTANYDGYEWKSLRRVPTNTHFSQQVQIPELEIKGTHDCVICLEPVQENKYITSCKHIFHTQCIFDYLSHIGLVSADICDTFCNHGPKMKPFSCPSCKQTVSF